MKDSSFKYDQSFDNRIASKKQEILSKIGVEGISTQDLWFLSLPTYRKENNSIDKFEFTKTNASFNRLNLKLEKLENLLMWGFSVNFILVLVLLFTI